MAGLSAFDIRSISVDAVVDPRTLQAALGGESVRPTSLVRIRRVLEARDLLDLLPGTPTPRRRHETPGLGPVAVALEVLARIADKITVEDRAILTQAVTRRAKQKPEAEKGY